MISIGFDFAALTQFGLIVNSIAIGNPRWDMLKGVNSGIVQSVDCWFPERSLRCPARDE